MEWGTMDMVYCKELASIDFIPFAYFHAKSAVGIASDWDLSFRDNLCSIWIDNDKQGLSCYQFLPRGSNNVDHPDTNTAVEAPNLLSLSFLRNLLFLPPPPWHSLRFSHRLSLSSISYSIPTLRLIRPSVESFACTAVADYGWRWLPSRFSQDHGDFRTITEGRLSTAGFSHFWR